MHVGNNSKCREWADKLVETNSSTLMTMDEKLKQKELYQLWEQKTGINMKEGAVNILGIRTRQLMHEHRKQILEEARTKPGATHLLHRPFLR